MMLSIRNMESDRCKSYVQTELNRLGIPYQSIELGGVKLKEDISPEMLNLMDIALRNAGLELIQDRKVQLVEKIKTAIHQLIYSPNDLQKQNISGFISKEVNRDYSSLSKLFTAMKGITIEKYIIAEKIGRVKKLLNCNKISLAEIAFKLQYSSVAHLSAQFKKSTGITPSVFKDLLSKKIQKEKKV